MIVTRLGRKREVGAEKSATNFTDQLFRRVSMAAETASQIAIKAGSVSRMMHTFVSESRVVGLGIAESLERRHLDTIRTWGIKGAIAAMKNDGAGRLEKRLGPVNALQGADGRIECCIEMRGQIVDLFTIEHRVGFQEWDGVLGLFAILGGLGARVCVGVYNLAAALAFAHLSAKLLSLFIRHPDRAAKSLRGRRGPQYQDVYAAVGHFVVALGSRDPTGGMFGVPGLHPWPDAIFKSGDDAACDLGINVGFCGGIHTAPPFTLAMAARASSSDVSSPCTAPARSPCSQDSITARAATVCRSRASMRSWTASGRQSVALSSSRSSS